MSARYARKVSTLRAVIGSSLIALAAGAQGTGVDVPAFGGNAQHTSLYETAAAPLDGIRWSTSIDLAATFRTTHYGAPLVTRANTVIVPVKTATDGFLISAHDGWTGALKYQPLASDYVLPGHNWVLPYQPVLATHVDGATRAGSDAPLLRRRRRHDLLRRQRRTPIPARRCGARSTGSTHSSTTPPASPAPSSSTRRSPPIARATCSSDSASRATLRRRSPRRRAASRALRRMGPRASCSSAQAAADPAIAPHRAQRRAGLESRRIHALRRRPIVVDVALRLPARPRRHDPRAQAPRVSARSAEQPRQPRVDLRRQHGVADGRARRRRLLRRAGQPGQRIARVPAAVQRRSHRREDAGRVRMGFDGGDRAGVDGAVLPGVVAVSAVHEIQQLRSRRRRRRQPHGAARSVEHADRSAPVGRRAGRDA